MNKTRMGLFVYFLLWLNVHCALAQCMDDYEELGTMVDRALDFIHKEQFEEGLQVCKEAMQQFPDNPMGYIGAAAIYQTIMRNYRVSVFEAQFDSLMKLGIEKGEKATRKHKKDAACYFFLGAGYGFRGLHRISKRQWLSAFFDGIKGYTNLKKAYKLDPTLYDAYYGLGLFYYWRSSKAKILHFLKMMPDERQKGIDMIKVAIEKGRFAALDGQFALLTIYFYEKEYPKAFELIQNLGNDFSSDPTWLYMHAQLLEKFDKWWEARESYEKLLGRLLAAKYQSIGFQVECHYGIANCSFKLGEIERAYEECVRALELSKTRDASKEIEGPLYDFSEILDKAKDLYEKLEAN